MELGRPDVVPPAPAAPPARGPRRLLASERADREWHRVYAFGLLLAVLVHVLVLLSWRVTHHFDPPLSAAGPDAGDTAAAAGGDGGMQVVQLQVREAVPDPVAVVFVPEEIVVVEPEPAAVPEERPASPSPVAVVAPGTGTTGTGGETGASTGPGLSDGTGLGAGGSEAAGTESRLVSPRPRGMILPPTNRPRDVRGDVKVWVFVTAQGRVVADSTRLEPPTRDANYNRQLRRSAAEWIFEPGRRDGQPVPAWYSFEVTL
jgi:hypothetical protein